MKQTFEHKGQAAEVRSVALGDGGYGWAYVIKRKHAGWSKTPHFPTKEEAVEAGMAAARLCIDARESTGVWPKTSGPPEDGDYLSS